MKPLPNQPRNRIISAAPVCAYLTEAEQRASSPGDYSDLAIQTAATAPVNVARQLAEVDPVLAYGCVDWYLYRDSNGDVR
jgi:hypothetical protein